MERKLHCIRSYLEKTQRKKGVTVNIEYLGGCGLEPSHVVGVGGVRWCGHSGRKIGRQFLKKLHTLLPYGSAILLGCYPRETKACTPTKTGAQAPTNWWMNRQAVACPSYGGFSAVKRKYTHYERNEPPAQQAGWKKPEAADRMLWDCIYMKWPEKENWSRQKVGERLPGAGGRNREGQQTAQVLFLG